MSNGFSIVPNTTSNFTLLNANNSSLNAGNAATMILLNAPALNGGLKELKLGGPYNIQKIEAQLDSLAETNPKFADTVRAEVMKSLSPVERGQLEGVRDGIMKMGPDGRGYNFAEPGKGVSQDEWLDRAKVNGHPDYPGYVAIAGSEDRAALKKAMDDVYAGKATLPVSNALIQNSQTKPNGIKSEKLAAVTSKVDQVSVAISAAEYYASNGGYIGNWTAVVSDGKIVKMYKNGFKGNQFTVTVSAQKALAPLLQKIVPATAIIGLHSSVLQYENNQISGAHLAGNVIMTGVGFLGPVGAGVSLTYGIVDAYYPGGVGQFARDVNNNPVVQSMGKSIQDAKAGGCPPMYCGS
jgi:hypothetical protein